VGSSFQKTQAAIDSVGTLVLAAMSQLRPTPPSRTTSSPVALPSPSVVGSASLEETLARRRSVRSFSPRPLGAAGVGQLLWAAQGMTDEDGRRTAPSAGATYPLELYALTADGVFRYQPADHALQLVRPIDARPELAAAADGQECVASAPLILAITSVAARTEARYQSRAEGYIRLEAGHAAQNVLLQAVALGLGAVPVGWFDKARVGETLEVPPGETPLYLIPVGHPAQ